jgi:pimeloyl-ACP methyl ester carboxylesterase
VHGVGAANALAWNVRPALERQFTLYAMDRRGHGASGDGPTYAIEREFEDVAAVVDSLETPVYLLGHSFGGLCALEAALLTQNVRKLVLYEPLPIRLFGEPDYQVENVEKLDRLLDAGDRERALTTFYGEIVGLSDRDIGGLKSSPAWGERLASAHTIPRELRAEEGYRFDPLRFKELETPALLLVGGDSQAPVKRGCVAIAGVLKNGRTSLLPGQEHLAMYTAPDLFFSEVQTFLDEN